MKKILVVIDMQNDFIDGSLGTKEAVSIVESVVNKIENYPIGSVYATRDTHTNHYMDTQEGKFLSVPHCIQGTVGWKIKDEINKKLEEKKAVILDKPTFGSEKLAELLFMEKEKNEIQIELIGLCTDICVVSNALYLKAKMPEVLISVDASCCAGVTPESHDAALITMKMCQVKIN